MSLSSGTRLGSYEILTPLGAGGMGEVYRAKDTKLGREVAIKVLPAAFAQDSDRLARFEREARVLASLNHPNIAAIYGVEERALVMELVEGESPAPSKGGAMPFEEAWKIASQIAAALEYAHDKGIIHRDLKPANVKVTPDGVVKLLDFGLAKAMDSRSDASTTGMSPETSPTLTIRATEAGMILGTAAYMAPEQARGKSVDKRADIWAFGVVFHELLTGERLFQGEDAAETLAAVIHKQPDLTKVPAQARPLIEACLEKDPKKRLKDIGDAQRLLSLDQRERSDAEAFRNAQGSYRSRWSRLYPIAVVVLALAALGLAFVHFRETPPHAAVVNSAILPPAGTEFDFAGGAQAPPVPAISPDGTRIVFGAKAIDGKSQLWIRRLDSDTAQPLPGTEGGYLPFWSPDSRWVGFGQEKKLKKIDIQGGPPVTLADITNTSAFAFRGGSWNSQDIIVYGERGGDEIPIKSVPAAGGTSKPVTASDKSNGASGAQGYPWFLPDGRHFLYTSQMTGDIPVRVGSLDEPGKPGKVVAKASSNAMYAQGYLLYLRENTLMAQPFDAQRLQTTGEAVPVSEGVPTYTSPSRLAGFTVSTAGLIAFQAGGQGGQKRLVWKDRSGKSTGNLGDPVALINSIRLSPDGRSLAAATRESNDSTAQDLWIYDVDCGIRTRFTFDPANETAPAWSPDGKTIYFVSDRGHPNRFELLRKPSNGAGTEEQVVEDARVPSDVSRDGKILLFTRNDTGKMGIDMWLLPLTPGGKSEPRVYLQTPFNEAQARFSPSGLWVTYTSNESGQNEVYAAPFPGPGGKRQISAGGGQGPRWSRDGKEIFYLSPELDMMAAEVAERSGTLEVGQVKKLFSGVSNGDYDVTADGQKFIVVDSGEAAARPLTLVQNWTATLRK